MTPPTSTVIHDLGYRHYDGPRLGRGHIGRALALDTLRGAYGLGRAARSKVMPMLLLGVVTLPALIIVIVVSTVDMTSVPGGYPSYPVRVQAVLMIFVGAQAPAVMSKDLRYRVVPLYFSRPLDAGLYVLARYAGFAAALFALLAVPLTVLLLGTLLAELPWDEQVTAYAQALGAAALLALVLAGIGLTIAALTPRRGLGVAAIVAVLLVLSGVYGAVSGLATEFDQQTLRELAGLLSPFSVVDGTVAALGADAATTDVPPLAGLGALYPATALLVVAACVAALLWRYRRAGSA